MKVKVSVGRREVSIGTVGGEQKKNRSVRGEVKGFSARSRARLSRYLNNCVSVYHVFITLTYGAVFPMEGAEAKYHLDVFLQKLMRFAAREGVRDPSVCWFLEYQERGAPHFHCLTNFRIPKDWIAREWSDAIDDPFIKGTCTRVEALRKSGVAYALKYAAKCEQKDVPEGITFPGRFWGVRGDKRVVTATYVITPTKRGLDGVKMIHDLMRSGMKSGSIKSTSWDFGLGVSYYTIDQGVESDTRYKAQVMIILTRGITEGWCRQVVDDFEVEIEGDYHDE